MDSKHLLQTKVEPGQSAETKLVLCSRQLQRPLQESGKPSLTMSTPVVAVKVWTLTHAFSVSVWKGLATNTDGGRKHHPCDFTGTHQKSWAVSESDLYDGKRDR